MTIVRRCLVGAVEYRQWPLWQCMLYVKVSTHPEDAMAYTLPSLPYAANDLRPYIDTMTMEIHHGRHHKAYVDNVNKALESQPALAAKPIDQLLRQIKDVPESIRQAVINNGGGHANHTMFWEIMAKGA